MKNFNKNIIRGLMGVASLGLLASCSNDYLQVDPETTQSTSTVVSNVDMAQQAIYGICQGMQSQYSKMNWNNNNGECYINNLLNDGLGQDYHNGLTENVFGPNYLDFTNNNIADPNLIMSAYPWKYAYNIIGQANNILSGIDNAEGTAEKRDFVKAQALTFRAFGYSKLLMMYAPRWEDSKNGETYCMVLRTEPGTDDMPLAKMIDVLDQCYKDLDEAIALYESSKLDRTYKWEPNLAVCQGVYTRIALIKNDWKKAQEMAKAAREKHPVMDNDTYLSGFFVDNTDFMWICSDDASDIYYYSNGSNYAVNGAYVQKWEMGAGAIDLTLYRALDPNDIRRQCYYTPDKVKTMTGNKNPGRLTEADYWNEKLVDPSLLCTTNTGPTSKPKDGGKWGMVHVGIRFAENYIKNIYKGDQNDIENDGLYAYYTIQDKLESGFMLWTGNVYVKLHTMPIGAQFKFFSKPPYGVQQFPFMRGSEMCLAEAEAAYHNGDVATAQACLNEINGKRIPGYTCTSTGEALFEEIKLCRRIELWGEGQNFSDFKRWNMPIVRSPWIAGDPTSGNWQPNCAANIPPTAIHGFRLGVPKVETNYNHLIDETLLYK